MASRVGLCVGLLCWGLVGACGSDGPTAIRVPPDTTAPVISLGTALCCGFPTGSTVTLVATASDNVGVTYVQFFVQPPGAAAPAPLYRDSTAPFEATYPDGGFRGADNGTHTFSAQAFDSAGNVGHSNPTAITIAIDVTPPVLSIIALAERLTTPGVIRLQVNSNEGLAKLELYDDGALRGEITATVIPYYFTPGFGAADNGVHAFTAKGFDGDGNVGMSDTVLVPVDIRWEWITGLQGPAGAAVYGIAADGAALYVAGGAQSAPDTNGFTTSDGYVAKLSSDGGTLWHRTFGDVRNQQLAYSAAVDRETGDVYMAGDTYEYGVRPETQVFLVKYDANGTFQWSREAGDTLSESGGFVAADGAGAIYVAGSTWGSVGGNPNLGGQDGFVVKYDRDGNVVWTRQFGSSGGPFNHDQVSSIAVGSDGAVYVGGNSDGSMQPGTASDGYRDAFLVKYDAAGNYQWGRLLGVAGPDDYIGGVSVAPSGDVYVVGYNRGGLDGDPVGGLTDILVAQFAPDGTRAWARQLKSVVTYAGAPWDYGSAVAADAQGAYVTGLTTANLGGNAHQGFGDLVLARYASDGSLLWVRTLGGPGEEGGSGVAADGLGGVYVAGGGFVVKHREAP